jgi:cytochrome c
LTSIKAPAAPSARLPSNRGGTEMPAPRTFTAATLCALLMATPLAAQASPPPMSKAEAIALGARLVERNCGMCHATGRGAISANPNAPPFRALNQRFDVEQLGEGLTTGILTGHPAMPEFRFEPYEVVAIVRYLRSVQVKGRAL